MHNNQCTVLSVQSMQQSIVKIRFNVQPGNVQRKKKKRIELHETQHTYSALRQRGEL